MSFPPAYPSSSALAATTSRAAIRPLYPRTSSTSSSHAPPHYDADHPPPYFPTTPLEPWLAQLRRKHWACRDLATFGAPSADECSALRAELAAWDLPTDPNTHIRDAVRDPFGWCGVTARDIIFADSAFPAELANTVLSLRPREHATTLNDDTAFSPDLLGMSLIPDLILHANMLFTAAITATAALGKYPHAHEWRPLRYHISHTAADPADAGPYRADWLLACVGWALPRTLGALLLPQADYARLASALFLVQARRKWAADARALLAARRRNPLFRWRHGRRSRQASMDDADAKQCAPRAGFLPPSFSIAASLSSFWMLGSASTIAVTTS
jgi:hypothetical protein